MGRYWLLLALLLCIAQGARAHQAPSGWTYPRECCADYDCGPITKMELQADGGLRVTTKHGTADFPAGHPRRESPDAVGHACFTPTQLYCLFLPAGT